MNFSQQTYLQTAGCLKNYPPFAGKGKEILLPSKWTVKFINLQLRFAYLAFKYRPPDTGDRSLQSQNLQCT